MKSTKILLAFNQKLSKMGVCACWIEQTTNYLIIWKLHIFVNPKRTNRLHSKQMWKDEGNWIRERRIGVNRAPKINNYEENGKWSNGNYNFTPLKRKPNMWYTNKYD